MGIEMNTHNGNHHECGIIILLLAPNKSLIAKLLLNVLLNACRVSYLSIKMNTMRGK